MSANENAHEGFFKGFKDADELCPEGYRYYYVEYMNLVGRVRNSILHSEVFIPERGWVFDEDHEISDRIIGYDPSEEPGWRMGNIDIMEEICPIARDEAAKLIMSLFEG